MVGNAKGVTGFLAHSAPRMGKQRKYQQRPPQGNVQQEPGQRKAP